MKKALFIPLFLLVLFAASYAQDVYVEPDTYVIQADYNGWLKTCYTEGPCNAFDERDSIKREGFIFQGWMIHEDDTDFIVPGGVIENPLSKVDGDTVTIYAKWFEVKKPKKSGDCYQIGSANELYGFMYMVNGKDNFEQETNACAELTADIVVNKDVLDSADTLRKDNKHLLYWIPIGTEGKPFSGKFNGKGHSISGLYFKDASMNNVGFFGAVQGSISIDSLELLDSYFEGKERVGGFIGGAAEKTKISITHSHAHVALVGIETGGFIDMVSESSSVVIDHSYRSGKTFGGEGYTGGLIGLVKRNSFVSIRNSHNDASIELSMNNGWSAGGLVGVLGLNGEGLLPGSWLDSLVIDSCYNAGAIKGPKADPNYGVSRVIGGLVGEVHAGYVEISNSCNAGLLTTELVKGNTCTLGGLVGTIFGALKITRSHNSGEILGGNAAGLVVEIDYLESDTSSAIISESYNEGHIKGTLKATGLLAFSDGPSDSLSKSSPLIINSYNVGNIEEYDAFYKKSTPGSGVYNGSEAISFVNSYDMSTYVYGTCRIIHITFDNAFYINKISCNDTEPKNTESEFADGSIAWALYNYVGNGVDGHMWGQKVGVDPYPVLNGAGVEGYNGEGTTPIIAAPKVNKATIMAPFRNNGRVFDIQGREARARHTSQHPYIFLSLPPQR